MPQTIAPTPERLAKGPVRRAATTTQDTLGRIAHPWHAQNILDAMLARADICEAQHTAGIHFAAIFQRAGVSQLRATSFEWNPSGPRTAADISTSTEHAYRQLQNAISKLGGLSAPTGSIAFAVLGLGDSLTLWASTQHWTGNSTAAAKGVLISALELLAQHFGLTKRS
jgi:xanthine dehydrogenase molybdopterin-binding subunit B